MSQKARKSLIDLRIHLISFKTLFITIDDLLSPGVKINDFKLIFSNYYKIIAFIHEFLVDYRVIFRNLILAFKQRVFLVVNQIN